MASRHAVALYRCGRAWDPALPLGEQPGMRDHVAFLTGLARDGVVELAGPFHDTASLVRDTDLVGLVVFRGEVEAARSALVDDPALRAGVMECDVLPWFA